MAFRAIMDPELKLQTESIAKLTSSLSFKWVAPDVLFHSVLAAVFSAAVFTFYSSAVSEPSITVMPHMILGIVLGLLLVARVIVGTIKAAEVLSQIVAFNKGLRTIAVFSTYVNETLTIASGAELEKKAVANFRYELVRLLNLSFHCYALMLQGLRLAVPPASLTGAQGEALASAPNPTVLVAKMVASLFEQQRAAKRISSEQTALMMGKVGELVEAYHASLAMLLSPAPVSLTAFTYFFTAVWTYVSAAAIAEMQLAASGLYPTFGFGLTLVYSGFLSLFVFGLYEAGNVVEAPLKSVMALIVTEDMSTALADDLTSLVED